PPSGAGYADRTHRLQARRPRKNCARPPGGAARPPTSSPEEAPMANVKEFDVKVQRAGKVVILPIKAVDAETARVMAERLLKRRGGKHSRVLGTTEKKP